MKKLMTMTRQFRDDENGAAMVEYTILLGLIAAATIATIVVVAGWISGTWANLCTVLGANTPVACVPPTPAP
ncbi:Flp family type IVb pilin [Mesorhizobium sp. dw_380]|uniref:Flp family type IVb pilin n=1 Tax=Mesorhizobium sp. dw_380 TaxID=2812001 RepID=UPI001BDE3B45|nr:Flp family type IVb pilin [Mesorhizobium sp. dw_380]